MAHIATILTLISNSIEQEVIAESTEHKLIELLLHEFVSIHLVDLAFALSNSTLAAETSEAAIQRTFSYIFFDYNGFSQLKTAPANVLTEIKL